MARRQFVRAVPVLIALLSAAGCEHSRTLPLGPSPRVEAAASSPATADVAALQRAVEVLAADPAYADAARQAVAELPEAKKFAQRFDAEFWARLEATTRSRPSVAVPAR